MAQFNLNDYETVEQRIARFYKDNPDGQIVTKNLTTLQDRQVSTWVVQAKIYVRNPLLGVDDRYHEDYILKSTGLAFEIDGTGMANKTSALENAETSAIGRALANAGYSGNKRTTREEMAKVERGETPQPAKDWVALASDLEWKDDIDGLMNLYAEASRLKAPTETLEKVAEIGTRLRAKTATKQPK